MSWLPLAFISALLLGLYDVSKKVALRNNAVIPILLINTVLCSLLSAACSLLSADHSPLSVVCSPLSYKALLLVGSKSVLVLGSWLCGYFAIKHLPITLVGPVNATRPVLVLLGAILIYGESPNLWQWMGIALALIALFLLMTNASRPSADHNPQKPHGLRLSVVRSRLSYKTLLILATLLGAASGLYDKYLLSPSGAGLNRYFVQTWFNAGQALLMVLITLLLWVPQRRRNPFHWHPAILAVSLLLTAADMVYFYALSHPDAMISIVSMVRRSSVIVSFAYGAIVLHEKGLRYKIIDLLLLALSMVFLALGA